MLAKPLHQATDRHNAQDNRPFDERVEHGRGGDAVEYLEPDDETPPW